MDLFDDGHMVDLGYDMVTPPYDEWKDRSVRVGPGLVHHSPRRSAPLRPFICRGKEKRAFKVRYFPAASDAVGMAA
jgi:hypothetical protein